MAGEDLGLLSSNPSIHPGKGTDARLTDALLTSRPPANHLLACINGATPGWVGDEGRCGGGWAAEMEFTLVVALPTLEGTPFSVAFLITSGVFHAFILACSVYETISSIPSESTGKYCALSEPRSSKAMSSPSSSIRRKFSSISLLKNNHRELIRSWFP